MNEQPYLEVTERNTHAIISTLRSERDAREGMEVRLQAAEAQITGLTTIITELQGTVLFLRAEVESCR